MDIENIIIGRKDSINRIIKVYQMIASKEYKELRIITVESFDIEDFIDNYNLNLIDIVNIHLLSIKDLEKILKLPFYRKSFLYKYTVKGE